MNELEVEPLLWLIWYKAPGTDRWVRAGRAGSRAEALTLVGGTGEWRFTPAR